MIFTLGYHSSDIGAIAKFSEHGAQAYRPARLSDVPIFGTVKTQLPAYTLYRGSLPSVFKSSFTGFSSPVISFFNVKAEDGVIREDISGSSFIASFLKKAKVDKDDAMGI